jgi:hypothetical protein
MCGIDNPMWWKNAVRSEALFMSSKLNPTGESKCEKRRNDDHEGVRTEDNSVKKIIFGILTAQQ